MEVTRREPESEPEDRRIRRSLWVFAGALGGLALLVGAAAVSGGGPFDWLALALIAVAAGAAAANLVAVRDLEARRRGEAESVARLLRGLSRSVSADAIVDAIAGELASVVDADHVVVVRRRGDPGRLEATLVSRRPGVPSSTTTLPLTDLDEPVGDGPTASPASPPGGDGPAASAASRRRPARDARLRDERAQRVAERIAARVRSAYGLRGTLAAPLVVGGSAAGALVLSRRLEGAWPPSARRLLDEAAAEASFALDRAQSYRRAETEASTDALTGLPNRRYFDEFCRLLARRRRAGDALGAIMVDIDHFKRLNDTHGHAVGDDVLRAVAAAIAGAVRDDDLPARFGGEEFVVLLRNPTPQVAATVGERIRRSVAGLDLAAHGVPGVTVSVGAAIGDGPNEPVERLVEAADRALYRAKRAGRDRVVVGDT